MCYEQLPRPLQSTPPRRVRMIDLFLAPICLYKSSIMDPRLPKPGNPMKSWKGWGWAGNIFGATRTSFPEVSGSELLLRGR